MTVSVAEPVSPVLVVATNRGPVVLLYAPVALVVTFTWIVHVPFAAIEPFENDIEVAPAVGANVGVPQPEVDAPGELATVMAPGEVGNVSVKLYPVISPLVGFVRVIVKVEVPPTTVVAGAKALAIVEEAALWILTIRADAEKSAL